MKNNAKKKKKKRTRTFVVLPFSFFFLSFFSGVCTTQDVDLFFKHMNNARYLRELDFARFHYYDRSGIYSAIVEKGGGAVQGASLIRYRRAIPIFTLYKVTTKVR